jgi:hypothetical protein
MPSLPRKNGYASRLVLKYIISQLNALVLAWNVDQRSKWNSQIRVGNVSTLEVALRARESSAATPWRLRASGALLTGGVPSSGLATFGVKKRLLRRSIGKGQPWITGVENYPSLFPRNL